MFTLREESNDFDKIIKLIQEYAKKLFIPIPADKKEVLIKINQKIDLGSGKDRKVYYIKEGTIQFDINTNNILYYETGDVIGLDIITQENSNISTTDTIAKVDVYSYNRLLRLFLKHKQLLYYYSQLTSYSLNLYTSMLDNLIISKNEEPPIMKHFAEGDIIITEGDKAIEVFTMIEGSAEALVNNVKVGEIHSDEIFGAMAAVTRSKRSATVIATTDCMIVSLSIDNFINLMKFKPSTVLKLVEDLSEKIISLNNQLVDKDNLTWH